MPNNSGVLIIVTGGNVCLWHDRHKGALKQATTRQIQKEIGISDDDKIAIHEGNLQAGELRCHIKDLRVNDPSLVDLELMDSSQVDPELWTKLAILIEAQYNNYEGFVVLHGLDTMAYTASALSFMLGNLNKPVVFTGSQRPINFTRTDAVENIISSTTFAGARTIDLEPVVREVTVYSGDSLFRANRVSMVHASSYQAFESSGLPALATMGASVDIQSHLVPEQRSVSQPELRRDTTAKVHILDIFPGIDTDILQGILRSNRRIKQKDPEVLKADGEGAMEEHEEPVAGILLRTYGMGTAPIRQPFLNALEELVDDGVLIVNVTQARSGRISHGLDPISLRLLEHGVTSGADMTSEAAYAKMVVLLSDDQDRQKTEDAIQIDRAGEQSQSLFTFHFEEGHTQDLDDGNTEFSAILKPLREMSTRSLLDRKDTKIHFIQLRILGLELNPPKKRPVSRVVTFEAYFVDKNDSTAKPPEEERLQHTLTWSKYGQRTINVALDITEHRRRILNRRTALRIDTWNSVRWKRMAIVVFADTARGR